MLKAYVTRWAERDEPDGHLTDFWFDSHIENAACWLTKEDADDDAAIFETSRVIIPSADGGTHTCSGFTVEQRAPRKFVIFCMAPFVTGTNWRVVGIR